MEKFREALIVGIKAEEIKRLEGREVVILRDALNAAFLKIIIRQLEIQLVEHRVTTQPTVEERAVVAVSHTCINACVSQTSKRGTRRYLYEVLIDKETRAKNVGQVTSGDLCSSSSSWTLNWKTRLSSVGAEFHKACQNSVGRLPFLLCLDQESGPDHCKVSSPWLSWISLSSLATSTPVQSLSGSASLAVELTLSSPPESRVLESVISCSEDIAFSISCSHIMTSVICFARGGSFFMFSRITGIVLTSSICSWCGPGVSEAKLGFRVGGQIMDIELRLITENAGKTRCGKEGMSSGLSARAEHLLIIV